MSAFPLDSGWAWIVVIGAFFAHVITHGIVYSFGILFIAIDDVYDASKAEISWIPSFTTGALYLVGPLASLLINHYGNRTTAILGACIGCLGYVSSMFVSSLHGLYVTMGIVSGCGLGMVFLPAILTVTKYFVKFRALACGIALSGAGGGAFILSPMIEHLLNEYAWKGTLLILAGILLNCIPCGLLFAAPVNHRRHETCLKSPEISARTEINLKAVLDNSLEKRKEEQLSLLDGVENGTATVKGLQGNNLQISEESCHNKLITTEKTKTISNAEQISNPNAVHMDFYDTTDAKLENYVGDLETTSNGCMNEHCSNRMDTEKDSVNEERDEQITVEIVDMFGKELIVQKTELEHTTVIKERTETTIQRYKLLFSTTDVAIFFISQFMFFSGFYLPFIYIPDQAIGHGIAENDAAWIASTMGISSIAGRIVLGHIADRPAVNRMLMFKVAIFIAGSSTAFIPLLKSLWLLLMYAVVYGVSTGITLSLTSVVLVDLAGLELLSDAMGINNVFSAFGSLVGPPIAGVLFDVTGVYTASFMTSGLAIILASVMLSAASFCPKRHR